MQTATITVGSAEIALCMFLIAILTIFFKYAWNQGEQKKVIESHGTKLQNNCDETQKIRQDLDTLHRTRGAQVAQFEAIRDANLPTRMDKVEARTEDHERRVGQMEATIAVKMDSLRDTVTNGFQGVDNRINHLTTTVARLDERSQFIKRSITGHATDHDTERSGHDRRAEPRD